MADGGSSLPPPSVAGPVTGARSPVALLDEFDQTGQCAPVVELGARAVAAARVRRLVRVVVLADVAVLVPLAHHQAAHLLRQRLLPGRHLAGSV